MTDDARQDLPQSSSASVSGDAAPLLDRQIQGRIGDHLRALYDGLVQQPVPERFHDLIARLEGGAGAPKSE